MATAETVIVELIAKVDQYNARLREAERRFNAATGNIQKSAGRMEREISRNTGAIGNRLKALAGVFAAAFSARQIQQLTDGYTRFTNQLAVTGLEGEQLARTQESLFNIGQRYGVQLETLGILYGRVAQAQSELGASSADILQLTEGVAAALRIQGSSAAEARGALIQLTQALGGEIVRAEEFNSINEGARPILVAVARNIDRFGGSVAALRREVIDGKVSSQEFFRAFVQGSGDLITQSQKVQLTIAASFTALNNALGKFIGETDQSLSATERISQAIFALADNLDKVTAALGVLAAVLLGRFAAGMVAAAGSTGLASAAIFAMQARAIGAATTMEALAFTSRAAGASMLAAFGGPVGLAVTALTLGIGYLAITAESAAEKMERLNSAVKSAEETADQYEKRLREAGISTEGAGSEASTAAGKFDVMTQAMLDATNQARALAAELERLGVTKITTRLAEIETERNRIQSDRAGRRRIIASQTRTGDALASGLDKRLVSQEAAEIAALQREDAALKRQLQAIITGRKAGIDVTQPPATPASPVADKDKKKKAKKDNTAERLRREQEAELRRQQGVRNELIDLDQAILDSMRELSTDIDERAEIERQNLDIEQRQFEENLATAVSTGDLKEAEAKLLAQKRQELTDAQKQIVTRQAEQDKAEEGLRLAESVLDNQIDLLRSEEGLTVTQKDRRRVALSILNLEYDRLRLGLESVIASKTATDAEKEIARLKLAQLDQLRANAETGIRRGTASPFEDYINGLRDISASMDEQLQGLAVGALDSLTTGLANAIANFTSLKDVARAALAEITAGLVKLAIQQLILKAVGQTAGTAAIAATTAQAAAAGAAWAPAAAAASLATLGANAGPAAAALASTTALATALALPKGFREGGRIFGSGGPTSDRVPIMASNDEFMVRARAAQRVGYDTLDHINRTGQLPRFASGGRIRAVSPSNASAAQPGGGFTGADIGQLEGLISKAVNAGIDAMPAVNLYASLDPADMLQRALGTASGQRALIAALGKNAGQVKATLSHPS